MKLTFDHAERLTDAIETLWFAPDISPHWTAGQFIEVTLPHEAADNRGIRRWFTLSSSPTEPLLAITTRFATEHGSSFKQALRQLQPGDSLSAIDAMGDFVLPLHQQTPLVFLAAGMGITPFHSIIQWLHATNQTRPIRLYHSVHQPEDLIFQNIFTTMPLEYTPIVTGPTAGWAGKTQPLTADYVMHDIKPATNGLLFISGPETMVRELKRELTSTYGLDHQRIITDAFPGYGPA